MGIVRKIEDSQRWIGDSEHPINQVDKVKQSFGSKSLTGEVTPIESLLLIIRYLGDYTLLHDRIFLDD